MFLCYVVDSDVVTIRLMLLPVSFVCVGRCYCQFCLVTVVIATLLV